MYTLCVHLRFRQTALGIEQALVTATTLWHARGLPTQDRCGHLMACSKAAYSGPIWYKPPAVHFGHLCSQAGEHGHSDIPPFDGATGDTPGVHPGLA